MSTNPFRRRWPLRSAVVGTAVTCVSVAMAMLGVPAANAAPANTAPANAAPASTAPAHANPFAPAYQHAYRHGAVPTREASARMRAYDRAHHAAAAVAAASNLAYGGGIDGIGVTTGAPAVYLVFWGSQWGSASLDGSGNTVLSGDPVGEAQLLQQLFAGLGTGGEQWSGVMTQYCDGVAVGSQSCPAGSAHVGYPTGGALAGVMVDNASPAPSSALGFDIGSEAVAAAAYFGNTTPAANRNAQYVILSPTGTTPDGFNAGGGFCAWHDYNGDASLTGGPVSSPYGDIAFTNMPYVTDAGASCGQNFVNPGSGLLDGVSMVEGHEYAETVTDQNPAGGWTDSAGAENADKCAWVSTGPGASTNVSLTTGTFAMQSTWSNDVAGCQIAHPVVF
jgi:hypothetical protein